MKILTYNDWLNEAKASEQYVNATITSPSLGMKKGDVVSF